MMAEKNTTQSKHSAQNEANYSSSSNIHQARLPEPACCLHSESGRNLVVCIDGTANQFGVNVSAIYFLIYALVHRSSPEHECCRVV